MAQIIDENARFEAPRAPAARFTVEGFSDLRYSSNAMAISNLPGGLELEGESDVTWRKGVTVGGSIGLGNRVTAYASVTGAHTNFFENDALNNYSATAVAGVQVRPARRLSLSAAALCVAEFEEDGFERYYDWCGPTVGANLVLASGRNHQLNLGARGTWALGDSAIFARYQEASVYLSYSAGSRVRFSLEPRATIRQFEIPDFVPAPLRDERVDYTASLEASLLYRRRHFEFGVAVEPLARWSNQAQYRYWTVRAGPVIRVMY